MAAKKRITLLDQWGLKVASPEQALMCSHCQNALRTGADSVLQHIATHQSVESISRDRLERHLKTFALSDVAQLIPRKDGSPHDPLLRTQPGYACRHCPTSSRSPTSSEQIFFRHLSSQHGISRRQARAMRDYDRVSLQCWASGGIYRYRWWIVHSAVSYSTSLELTPPRPRKIRRTATFPSQELSEGPTLPKLLFQIHAQERTRLQELDAPPMSLETAGQELSLIRPWHERTRWYETYRNRPRDVLYRLALLPDRSSQLFGIHLGAMGDQVLWSSAEDETRIHRILQHVDVAFDRCEETVRRTGHPILCWLRSRFPSRPFKAPFQLVGRDETRRKYRRRWRQVLAVGLRSVRFQPSVIRALGIPLTTAQITVIRQLWSIISSQPDSRPNPSEIEVDRDEEDSEEGEEDEDEENDEDDEDDEDHEDDDYIPDGRAEDASLPIPLVDNHNTGSGIISELIFKLSILLCRDEFTDGQPSSSALVYISGILAFTTDGAGFQTPRLYTPTISALIHLQLLLFLEDSLPCRQYPHLRISARPSRDHLEILNSVRCRYMCAGSLTPLGEMISLLDYGRSMLRSESPAFFVRWSDDRQTIFFDDHSLHMDQFRDFARSLCDSATDLYDQLMRQWQPEVSLEGIRDSFSNDIPGYSFVSDPANRLNDAYLQLSTRVCGMGPDGLIQNGEWDLPAVIEYLQLHDRGLHDLGQAMAINDGGMPRLGEMFTILVRNGPMNPRGIYVYDGSMMTFVRYTKAQRNTNREFCVARFQSPTLRRLLFYEMVYLRPLINMLLRECFKVSTTNDLLFSTNSVVARQASYRHWTTNDLTSAFRHSSNQVLGFPMGSRLLRQVTIAITETHVRENSRPFNRYDDYSANAPADVAFSWQSGHRPRVRAANYGRDGAFSHIVDAALLEAYRKVSFRWHNFLGVSSPRTKIASRTPSMNHVSGQDQITYSSTPLQRNIYAQQGVTRTPLAEISINHISIGQRHGHSSAPNSSTREQPWLSIQPPKAYQCPEVEIQAGTESCRKQNPSTQVRRASLQCRIGLASLNQGHYTPQEAFNSLFIHLPQYRIIICDACPEPFAVVPGHVETHIGKHHLHIPIHARKGIGQYVKTLAHLAHRPEDVIRPSITSGRIQALPVFDKGMVCLMSKADGQPCYYTCNDGDSHMKRHCREGHGWVNPQSRGGNVKSKKRYRPENPWLVNQHCQRFFREGAWPRFFPIEVDLAAQSGVDTLASEHANMEERNEILAY